MRKKLLAGVMALALCSTNMLPQTIFAGEFTSGNLEEVTEETPEIFTDDDQEVIEKQKKNYLCSVRRTYPNLAVKQMLCRLLQMERNL